MRKDLDWDQLTYITASAEAKERLKQDSENYRQQKEQQREQERKEQEQRQQRLRQQHGEEVNLAGLEALKRGFGLRGGHASHLLAPSASRTVAATHGANNVRMAADSVVAAAQLVEDGDLEAVTEEILARVRAQDAAEADFLPPLPEVEAQDAAQPAEEVTYAYHYGHTRGVEAGAMDEPSRHQVDEELQAEAEARQRSASRKRRQRARSRSRGRGLVSLYVEEGNDEEEEEKAPQKSRCPWGHGLERWVCRIEGVKCEECGPFPLPKHSVFFGCRQCDWHVCSAHGMAADPEAKPKAERKSAKASDAKPFPSPEESAEAAGENEPRADAHADGKGAPEQAEDVEAQEEETRQRNRPVPRPEAQRGRSEQKLSYKERMKQRLEKTAKKLEEGKDVRRYEWAETGEVASSRDAQGILDRARQEREEELEAKRPPSPRLDLPEDFCPLCHQIATGAKKPLVRGGHTFKAGCRRAKGA